MRRPNRSILSNHADKLPVTVAHLPVRLEPAEELSMPIAHPAVRLYFANGHTMLIPDGLGQRAPAEKHPDAYGNYFEGETKAIV